MREGGEESAMNIVTPGLTSYDYKGDKKRTANRMNREQHEEKGANQLHWRLAHVSARVVMHLRPIPFCFYFILFMM